MAENGKKRGKKAAEWTKAFRPVEGLVAKEKIVKVEGGEVKVTHYSTDDLQLAAQSFGGNIKHMLSCLFAQVNSMISASARNTAKATVIPELAALTEQYFDEAIAEWRSARHAKLVASGQPGLTLDAMPKPENQAKLRAAAEIKASAEIARRTKSEPASTVADLD